MGRTTVSWPPHEVGGTAPAEQALERHETGWRAFLTSWKWGAILAAGCVAGLIVIFSAHPFATPSVSERVSDTIGRPASCAKAGVASVAGDDATVYKCTVTRGKGHFAQCFVISGRDVRQISGNRRLGC